MKSMRTMRLSNSGHAMTMVCVVVAVLIALVCAALFSAHLYGAYARRQQDASDSGARFVGSTVLGLTVPLSVNTGRLQAEGFPQYYLTDNLGTLTDANGNVGLLQYNLIAARATEEAWFANAWNSPLAISRAQTLSMVVDELGGALNTAFLQSNAPNNLTQVFNQLASQNLGNPNVTGAVDTLAYFNPAQPSNVYLPTDSSGNPILPYGVPPFPQNFTTTVGSKAFLNGYEPLKTGNVTDLSLVPLQGDNQPHLVSLVNTVNGVDPTQPPTGVHPAVANCFSASVTSNPSAAPPKITSAVLASAFGQNFAADFHDGFIVIKNLQGANFAGTSLYGANFSSPKRIAGPDIFDTLLATNGGGTGLFVSNAYPNHHCSYCSNLANFQAYRSALIAGTPPPTPPPGTDPMHVDTSDPNYAQYIMQTPDPPPSLNYTMANDPKFAPTIAAMFTAFSTTEPPFVAPSSVPFSLNNVMALTIQKAREEYARYLVRDYAIAYPENIQNFNAYVPAPLQSSEGIYDPDGGYNPNSGTDVQESNLETGLTIFDHLTPYPSNLNVDQGKDIGTKGTPSQLLLQCGDRRSVPLPGGGNAITPSPQTSDDVLNALLAQVKLINPNVSLDGDNGTQSLRLLLGQGPVAPGELNGSAPLMGPGDTAYIYNGPDGSLTCSETPPSGKSPNAFLLKADGPSVQTYCTYSATYQTVDTLPSKSGPGDCGVNNALFASYPTPTSIPPLFGKDTATFTANSFASGLGGTLVFTNQAFGCGLLTNPN